jgi:uncharacterized repeat protein (TIGR03803 family)
MDQGINAGGAMTSNVQARFSKTRFRAASILLAAALAIGVLANPPAQAKTYKVLYTFAGVPDGETPYAPLIQDPAGNLNGTTYGGGLSGSGTVFKVDASGNETVLYSFTGGADGSNPYGGVIRDAAGNLYGTTYVGGKGAGVVFTINTSGQESVLYSFTGRTDGGYPRAGLVRDGKGNLYGTTEGGGLPSCECGVVFKVHTNGGETVLHSFANVGDGAYPYAGLIRDSHGNLYGTTSGGGLSSCECGVVFKLDNNRNETVLHNFVGVVDGKTPYGPVVLDSKGNLFGTTYGGLFGLGTVFKVNANGKETVLHSFGGGTGDGEYPVGGLVRDATGNLYGTTISGGHSQVYGVVFELNQTGTETLLYDFQGGTGGRIAEAGLLRDPTGNLYGTTKGGGNEHLPCYKLGGCGVVFVLTP